MAITTSPQMRAEISSAQARRWDLTLRTHPRLKFLSPQYLELAKLMFESGFAQGVTWGVHEYDRLLAEVKEGLSPHG